VKAERANRRSVSVFTHRNASTRELSDALTAANVRHEQVRLSEAYGEALNAQLAIQLHRIGVELQQLAPGSIESGPGTPEDSSVLGPNWARI
jgi:hypothetical protein